MSQHSLGQNEPITASLDDYRWLVGDEAAEILSKVAAAGGNPLPLATRLRAQHSTNRTHLLLEQVALRRRAKEKFNRAEEMWFLPRALEQATDEQIAAYKALRFPAEAAVADLCCGIGGDMLALHARGPAVAVDRDPASLLFAEGNCRAVNAKNGTLFPLTMVCGDVAPAMVEDCAAWHLDPDRRSSGRRTTRIDLYEPGLDVIAGLLAASPHAAVKLAPAAEPPESWTPRAELEWISRARQCRQLVAWFGQLTQHHGLRRATAIRADGSRHTILGQAGVDLPVASAMQRYLFEPDPAVLAAQLTGALAAELGLSAIAPGVVYLTGDRPISAGLASCFEVTDVLAYHPKRLKALLRERQIGRLEVKKRGVDLDPDAVRKQLAVPGDRRATLVLTRQRDKVIAVLTCRVQDAESMELKREGEAPAEPNA